MNQVDWYSERAHMALHACLRGGAQCSQCDYVQPLSDMQKLLAAVERLDANVRRLTELVEGGSVAPQGIESDP